MWLDIVILGIITISVLVGFIRGLVKEVLTLISWVLGFWVAYTYTSTFAELVTITELPLLRNAIAAGALFVTTVLVMTIINFVIYKLLCLLHASWINRSLGGCFGFLRAVVLLALVAILIDPNHLNSNDEKEYQYSEPSWAKGSLTYPKLELFARKFNQQLPEGWTHKVSSNLI